jgi:hypothetical protein
MNHLISFLVPALEGVVKAAFLSHDGYHYHFFITHDAFPRSQPDSAGRSADSHPMISPREAAPPRSVSRRAPEP